MSTNPSRPSNDILRLVAKNLTEMVLAYDMNRRLVFVNPAAQTLTGYTLEELEKANFTVWIHPEDQPRMLAFWENLFQGRGFHDEEYRLVTRDGRIKWVVAAWNPILDDSGVQIGVQGREFDITQRKLAETALRHSQEKLRIDEERYRRLFEDSPFPMWEEDFSEIRRYLDSLSASGIADVPAYLRANRAAIEECIRRVRILDVNRAARDFYGAAAKEELLGGLDTFVDEPAFEVLRDEMSHFSLGNFTFQTEFTTRTLKGEERIVDMIVSVVESARHDWSRVIVSFFDITDRKRLEEQFLQSQKMESLGRLAGGIAHDFNNLLTVINGYADWILRKMAPESPYRSELAEIRGAGQRCADLTQQLLAFSRKQIARTAPIDLNQFIGDSVSVLKRLLGDDIAVTTRLCPGLGIIEADPTQMRQVLFNLAANARDAMPSGGEFTIETANVDETFEVLLEVRDTGHGMDEHTRAHAFEPFFTTRKGAKNSGLGLAIVFGIVNHGGGRIQVETQPGAGTALRIFLPRVHEKPEPEAPAASAVTPGIPGIGLVLVVEDREDVRALTCRMLEELGYQTLDAGSGSEALALARRHHPIPVLLTDVIMPGMNGREVAGEFRRLNPQGKVVFMSGYTDRVLTSARTLDSDTPYLQKPFTLAQLGDILRRVQS